MKHIAFFRQYRVWLPTIFGLLLILLFFLVLSLFFVRNIYSFLAINEPVGARVLVVEGWLSPEELDQAVQAFRKGAYERIVTTGGPITGWPELFLHSDYATMAADYLAQKGVPVGMIAVVPAPKSALERTFLSAMMFRESANKLGIKLDAIDLFTSGPHARRSRLLYQMALGQKVRVGILAARPSGFDQEAWWRTSYGVETMVFQTIGFVWVKCCFWPGPPGSKYNF